MPQFCSTQALFRVLLEQGIVSYEDYLNLHCFLSSYRYRFLSISIDDFDAAIFGTKAIRVVNVNELYKLNFPLVLSEEYGVNFEVSLSMIIAYIYRLLTDDTILPDVANNIFKIIIKEFPTHENKNILFKRLLSKMVYHINNRSIKFTSNAIQEKLDLMLESSYSYRDGILSII